MTGDRLTVLARLILRERTFALIAAPAIADLQVEARTAGLALLLGRYAGVLGVLLRALLHDVRLDGSIATSRDALRLVWKPAISWYLGIAVTVMATALADEPWNRLGGDGARAVIAGLIYPALLMAFVWAIIAAFILLTRLGIARRTRVTIGLTLAIAAAGGTTAVRGAFSDVFEYAEAARWRATYGDVTRPLDDVVATVIRPRIEASARHYAVEWQRVYVWWGVQTGASVLALAIIGAVLARSRGWRLALRLAAMTATYLVLIAIVISARRGSDWSPMLEGWQSPAVLFTIALAYWVIVRRSDPSRLSFRW